MTSRRGHSDQPARPVPDHLIDSLLDGDLPEPNRRRVFERVRADMSACQDLASQQRCIDMLSQPIEAPDLTGRILGESDRRRFFLPSRLRRVVTAGRAAAAAGVLVTAKLWQVTQPLAASWYGANEELNGSFVPPDRT